MNDNTMTKEEAAAVVRVLLRIQQQIDRTNWEPGRQEPGRQEDGLAMARILGRLQFQIFGVAWDHGIPQP